MRPTPAGHEHRWRPDTAHRAALTAAFAPGPARLVTAHGAGHNLSLGHAARPCHLRALAFTGDCRTSPAAAATATAATAATATAATAATATARPVPVAARRGPAVPGSRSRRTCRGSGPRSRGGRQGRGGPSHRTVPRNGPAGRHVPSRGDDGALAVPRGRRPPSGRTGCRPRR
ncbi:hypothetical protein ACFV0O_41200 [Kitasatospora sp. NPDC059577]|uniref:hypothetical protein n=1 Tax=Kitasatospora sp. NPDC059577 TaxID=3346873 RepID=UPI003684DBCD